MKSKEIRQRFALVVKEVTPPAEIFKKMRLLLEEFKGVVHDELLKGLSPMKDIQYHVLKASLPKCPHYWMNPEESEVLKEKIRLKLEKINAKYKATAHKKSRRNSLRKEI